MSNEILIGAAMLVIAFVGEWCRQRWEFKRGCGQKREEER